MGATAAISSKDFEGLSAIVQVGKLRNQIFGHCLCTDLLRGDGKPVPPVIETIPSRGPL